MAAGGAASHSIGWDLFFIDLEQLVLDYEQLKASNFTTNYSLDETLLERFENAVQALRNMLPHVHHSHSVAAILHVTQFIWFAISLLNSIDSLGYYQYYCQLQSFSCFTSIFVFPIHCMYYSS